MVLWSWQLLQSACQLLSSQNSLASPLCGVMWSTTVAFTKRPCFLHSSQRGCAFKKRIRAFFHLPSYPRTEALARSEVCSFACSSQYIPLVSLGHPGCLHGFIGLLGMASPLPHTTVIFISDCLLLVLRQAPQSLSYFLQRLLLFLMGLVEPTVFPTAFPTKSIAVSIFT